MVASSGAEHSEKQMLLLPSSAGDEHCSVHQSTLAAELLTWVRLRASAERKKTGAMGEHSSIGSKHMW